MKRLLLLAVLVASPAAFAKKGKGGGDDEGKVRVSLSTPIFVSNSTTVTFTGGSSDVSSKTKTSGLALFDQPARFGVGYMATKNVEVGAFLAYSKLTSSIESDPENKATDGDGDPNTHAGFQLYGGYNQKIGESLVGFGQVNVGIERASSGDPVTQQKWTVYGLDAGVRYKIMKRASIDTALSYEGGKGKFFFDGDEVKDTEAKLQNIGLRTGLSIRI